MEIKEILVDKALLDGFKRRAYKHLPNEHLEVLIGIVNTEKQTLTLTSLLQVPYKATPDEVETEEFEAPEGMLGAIHSHPDGAGSPSEEDITYAKGEIIGICAISQRGKRKHTSFSFWRVSATPIELTIIEDEDVESEGKAEALETKIYQDPQVVQSVPSVETPPRVPQEQK